MLTGCSARPGGRWLGGLPSLSRRLLSRSNAVKLKEPLSKFAELLLIDIKVHCSHCLLTFLSFPQHHASQLNIIRHFGFPISRSNRRKGRQNVRRMHGDALVCHDSSPVFDGAFFFSGFLICELGAFVM